MGIIAVPLGWVMKLLYDLIQNYGITLIVFTVIFRICLYPLYKKQTISTMRMADVQPKMLEIQRKYANDKDLMNEKIMELYKEENFSPWGGCLPMIIQMPILFGFFALLRNPLTYIDSSDMIFAVHETFLWIGDLTQPDLWILPIAAGISTFISFSQNQAQQGNSAANNQMAPMMKMMKYVFPIMIVWMGRSFPAGLTMYWFMGTVVQIFLNLRLKKIRENMKKELEEKKRKKK